MSLLTDIQKSMKAQHVILAMGLFIGLVVLMQYNRNKGMLRAGMTTGELSNTQNNGILEEEQELMNSQPHNGMMMNNGNANGLPNVANKPVLNATELLPRDENSEWAKLNPRANGDFANMNLLRAGYWHGMDTVGSSLRNANLQIRSEPPNPTNLVSPWNNTTITPDLMRVPLE